MLAMEGRASGCRAAACLFLLAANLLAPAAGEVLVLDDISFDSEVTGHAAFVKFYAPWCGHCKKMAPTWESLAEDELEGVKVAQVDCTKQKKLMQRFGIKGFPSLVYFSKEGQLYKHTGPRSLEGLKAFAMGGWQEAEIYDPTVQQKRKSAAGVAGFSTVQFLVSVYNDFPKIAAFLAAIVLLLVVVLIFTCCQLCFYDGGEEEPMDEVPPAQQDVDKTAAQAQTKKDT